MRGVKGMARERRYQWGYPGTSKVLVLYLNGGLMDAHFITILSPIHILLYIHILLLYL